ncbi:Ig-like domain-containing protein [Asticcacaulis sp.]|uniref:Ig-like domain-containing protein n=1 Tax=Asticcacaulis sp. TaxID=1872648 RepID=UPI0039198BFA
MVPRAAELRSFVFAFLAAATVFLSGNLAPSALAQSTSYQYDALGRVVQVTFPNGSTVVYAYDSAGNRTQVTRTRGTNGVPSAVTDSVTTSYQTAVTISPLANDVDPDGDTITLTGVGTPAHGTASVSGSQVTYTPAGGYSGSDTFSYTISDGFGGTATGQISVVVSAPPAPSVSATSLNLAYNTAGNVSLPVSGVYSSLAIASQSANGTASISGTTATFTPTAGFIGATSFTFTASGPGGTSAPATVTVNVAAPPAPTVSNVTLNTAYNTAGSTALSPAGVYSSLSIVSQSSNGTASISGTTVTFTPNAGYYGSTSFTYRATGPGGSSAPATVTVNVAAPGAPSVSNVTLNTAYNTAGTATLSPSGVYSSLAIASQSANGTASISGTTATFTPTAGFIGSTSFTYTATGPGGTSAPATVSVTVAAPPAPTVSNVTLNAAYNTAGTATLAPSGVYSSLSIVSQSASGTATISGTTVTFTPNTGFYGTTTFTYRATGPGGASAPATVNVTVANPPAPTVSNATISTAYNTAGTVTVSPGGVYSSLAIAAQSVNGTASVSGSTITFTPNNGYSGTTSFTYTATGPGGTSAAATVTVTVAAAAGSFVLNQFQTIYSPNNQVSLTFQNDGNVVLKNGTNVVWYTGTWSTPANQMKLLSNGNLVVTSASGATIHWQSNTAGSGGTQVVLLDNAALAILNASGQQVWNSTGTINVAPVATNDAVTTQAGTAITFDPRTNDSDSNSDPLTITSAGPVSNGTVSFTSSLITYTPAAGYSGTVSFPYTISDGRGGTSSATVSVTVSASALFSLAKYQTVYSQNNQVSLTFQNDGNIVLKNGTTVVWYTGTWSTPASEMKLLSNGNLVVTSTSGTGTTTHWQSNTAGSGGTQVVVQNNGTLAILNASGQQVWNSSGNTNTPPVANADSKQTKMATALTFDPRTNDTDADGNTLTITGVGTAANGTVSYTGTSVTYTPNAGFAGTDTFTYTISDGQGGTSTATVTMTVYFELAQYSQIYSPNGNIRLILQNDGNLVLYNVNTYLWGSGTWNTAANVLRLIPNGNVELRSPSAVLWQANTAGMGGVKVQVRDNGTWVVVNSSGMVVWSSGT